MSLENEELIAATTGTGTSRAFQTVRTKTVMADTLGSGETVTLQQTHDGSTWQDVVLNGTTQQLSSTHTLLTIVGPGVFRVTKTATASAVAVNLWSGA